MYMRERERYVDEREKKRNICRGERDREREREARSKQKTQKKLMQSI